MDVHLRELFGNFQHQFGLSGGAASSGQSVLPPLSPNCVLTKIDGVSSAFIKAIFRACSALYMSNPWLRLRPHHLFGVSVHGSKPFFSCAQFIGNSNGDPALLLYRSHSDALSSLSFSSRGTRTLQSIPAAGLLRLTFATEPHLPPTYKKMIKTLGLDLASPKAYPFIDLVYSPSNGNNGGFSDANNGGHSDGTVPNVPTLDELRWLYACVKAIAQFHPSLHQVEGNGRKLQSPFEELVQTLDVQWPAEDAKFWEVTSVTLSHPPQQDQEEDLHRLSPSKGSENLEAYAVDLNGWTVPRQCAMCSKEVPADMAPRCSRCKAVIYCGHACQKQHWKEQHKGSCELYKAMMEREEELELKGFLFPCLMEQACKWLESVGLHGKGMWRRMCGCFKEHPFGLLPASSSGGGLAGAWGLEHGHFPPDTPLSDGGDSGGMVLLSGWPEYYSLRGLPLLSPVATLLSFPLSLYHIVASLSVATKMCLAKGREAVVHYLGPEGELDWVPAFSEVAQLLGGSGNLHIVMIGPEVPNSLSGAATSLGKKLKVTFVKGLYQEEINSLPSPQVVVALNSGLETYGSWLGALEVIKALGTPAFFTDFSEPCCANAKQVLRAAGLHISYPVTPNPFRSPVRNQIPSSNLPWFSNGFVFGVNT